MSILDTDYTEALREGAAAGLLAALAAYPAQIREGLAGAQAFAATLTPLAGKVDEIVVCSVGGGPVAALLQLKSLLSDELHAPVMLSQAYTMPAYVDADSLVFIVNYSGGSEEIVSAYRSALATGATIVVLTAGGVAAELAAQHGHPCFRLPPGQTPRLISLSHVLVPMLVILHRLGLVADPQEATLESAALLERLWARYGPECPQADNEAKQLAADISGLVPVVYGTLPYTDGTAVRFKHQLAETARVMAFNNAMSGLHHDEANGWDAGPAMLRSFHFTLIRDAEDSEPMARRLRATEEALLTRAGGVTTVVSIGESRLARACSLSYLFDCAALYVALLRGVDPAGPNEAMAAFRAGFNR